MSTHVRLKHIDKDNPTNKDAVTELAYGKFNVPFTRFFSTPDGFKAVCRSDRDTDKILTKEAIEEFVKHGLSVIIPPEIKAKRSIFVRRLDARIGKNNAEDIKEELERVNNWMKIDEVHKIKDYTHLLKISFEEVGMAERAQHGGFLALNMAITSDQVEQEEYVNLSICFNCYVYEDHLIMDCPEKDVKYCSECCCTGHVYRECTSTTKTCLNCFREGKEGSHRTLAMACPIRKKIIREKKMKLKEQESDKENTTYAEIARKVIAESKQTDQSTQIILSQTQHCKILICIMHAHVMNHTNQNSTRCSKRIIYLP